jgi:hypothetical protein
MVLLLLVIGVFSAPSSLSLFSPTIGFAPSAADAESGEAFGDAMSIKVGDALAPPGRSDLMLEVKIADTLRPW